MLHRRNVIVDETSYQRNDFRRNVMEAMQRTGKGEVVLPLLLLLLGLLLAEVRRQRDPELSLMMDLLLLRLSLIEVITLAEILVRLRMLLVFMPMITSFPKTRVSKMINLLTRDQEDRQFPVLVRFRIRQTDLFREKRKKIGPKINLFSV